MRVVTKCAEILLRNARCYKMHRNFVTKCARCYICAVVTKCALTRSYLIKPLTEEALSCDSRMWELQTLKGLRYYIDLSKCLSILRSYFVGSQTLLCTGDPNNLPGVTLFPGILQIVVTLHHNVSQCFLNVLGGSEIRSTLTQVDGRILSRQCIKLNPDVTVEIK